MCAAPFLLKVGTQDNGGMEDTIRTIKCVKDLTPQYWEITDLMTFLTLKCSSCAVMSTERNLDKACGNTAECSQTLLKHHYNGRGTYK